MQTGATTTNTSDQTATPRVPLTALLFSISRTTRALMGVKLAELGLHNGQDELLLAIQVEHPLPISVVADRIKVRPSTTSKMVDRLAERGLVARATDGKDARLTLLEITQAGREIAEGVRALHETLEAGLLKSLTGDPGAIMKALAETDDLLAKRLGRLR